MTGMKRQSRPLSIAIVGAGAAGTLLAARVLRSVSDPSVVVRLIDPSLTTGRGLAYSTTDWKHRLNVASGKMSAFPEDPEHFTHWLEEQGEDANPASFAPRALYGEYIEQCLNTAVADSVATYERVHEQVVEVCQSGSRYRVRCSGASRFTADWVVLAIGSPRAHRSWAPDSLLRSAAFVTDPWHALEDPRVRDAKSALLVGSGLTMADIALTLGATAPGREPRKIYSISRNGQLPTAHRRKASPALPAPALPEGEINLATLRELVDRQIELSLSETGDWRPGIDSLRSITNDLWQALPDSDRDEFLAQDVRRWDALRHRMAPQTGELLRSMLASGQLEHRVGQVASVEDNAGRTNVELTDGTSLTVDVVVDCTGPAPVSEHAGTGEFLLANLLDSGLARIHDLNTGLDSDEHGRVLSRDGHPSGTLRIVGPMRKGALWETTAIPEIRVQVAKLAKEIADAANVRPKATRSVDLYGLELSTTPGAAEAFNEALGRLLKVQSGVEDCLATALERDPDFALAHLTMALLAHEYDSPIDATAHLARARQSSQRRATAREAALVACMGKRIEGHDASGEGIVGYLSEFPRDSLAASVAVPTIAFAGIYQVPEQSWQLVESLAPSFGNDWWYDGLLAFVRQEQGRFAEADQLAERALAMEPSAGTAVHARAHVFFETGQHKAGLEWLDEWISTCGRDAVHRAHFSWHAALHELAMGDDESVRRRYERQLAPPAVSGMRALVDSAALLWRWNIEGVSIEDRRRLAPVRAASREDVLTPKTGFAAMHAAIALALSRDLAGLESLRVHCWGSDDPVLREVAAPLATALSWFVAGHFSDAADLLLALEPNQWRLGGSDAQREVLMDTAIAALVNSGRLVEAAGKLQYRLDLRPRPRDSRALSAIVRQMSAPLPDVRPTAVAREVGEASTNPS